MTKYSLITYALFAFLVQTLPYVCSNFLEIFNTWPENYVNVKVVSRGLSKVQFCPKSIYVEKDYCLENLWH